MALKAYFDIDRVREDVSALYERTKRCTTSAVWDAAEYLRDRLSAVPHVEVRIVEVPADGRSSYGGWVMPKGWDVEKALLEIVRPEAERFVLARYPEEPLSLMLWSAPTPSGGIEGEVVVLRPPYHCTREEVEGKFVLVEEMPQVAFRIVDDLASKGVACLLTDYVVEDKGVRSLSSVEDARQYHNYANALWDGGARLPAFCVSPRVGRRLRDLIASGEKVVLRAQVEAKLYDGVFPVVDAVIRGANTSEFVLTAHMDEPGASDNASGTAVIVELLRCVSSHIETFGEVPRFGLRVLASSEVRGIQAYINSEDCPIGTVIGGLNIDMLGMKHVQEKTKLEIYEVLPPGRSFLGVILEDHLSRLEKVYPVRWKRATTVVVDDCEFSSLPYLAPMCFVGQPHEPYYHTSMDVPDSLDFEHIERMGRDIIAATVDDVLYPDLQRVKLLARRVFEETVSELREKGCGGVDDAVRIWKQLSALLDDTPCPFGDIADDLRREGRIDENGLSARNAFLLSCGKWEKDLKDLCSPVSAGRKRRGLPEEFDSLVPLKLFSGYVAWEDLLPEQRRVLESVGLEVGWGAPSWVQLMVDLCSGKRTLREIYELLVRHGMDPEPEQVLTVVRLLESKGMVRFRQVITRDDIVAALHGVGIGRGDVVIAHTSLSAFGYVLGGADAVIEAFLEVVGNEGTLVVPTHSLNWVGRPPYDPSRSPSLVGAVTNRFLQRKGVIRSMHPTHSVAALGPLAECLVAGHDHRVAPQGKEGFWGRFVEQNGKVVLMCPLKSNTILHAAELWAGIPYPPCRVHIVDDGGRLEVDCPGVPWHVDSFEIIHRRMFEEGLIRTRELGESTVYAMNARDAVRVGMEEIRKDPSIAVPPECGCYFCNYVRTHLRTNDGTG